MVVAIVGHHIDIVAVEIYLFTIDSRQRIVGIKAFSCPNPIAPLLIPIDGIGLRRRCRMCYNLSVCIKAIDAIVLYSTPDDTVITLTDRGH